MPVGDVVPELILVGGGVLVLVYALFAPRRAQSWAAEIALVVLGAVAVLTVPMLAEPQRLTFFSTYAVDGAAIWGKLMILGVTAVTILLCRDWFRSDPRHGELYTLLLFSAAGAIVLAGAADLMEVVLGALLSSATGYALAAYHRRSRQAAEAGIKYFLLGGLANGGFLYGVVLLFGLAGGTTLTGLAAAVPAADTLPLAVGLGLVVVGLAFKMGAVPVHAWMPDVADGSPAPSAAFLTAAPKIGALLALARILAVVPDGDIGWRPLIAVVAAATMTLGNLAALWQDDVRRLLGWSAVSQTGYGLLAVVALGRSSLAVPALLYFLATYALGNLAAFGVVIALRDLRSRADYAGLSTVRPGLSFALVLAFMSFVGIPPLAGFAAKLTLFGAAIEAGYAWLATLAVVNTVISLFYYARFLGPAYFEASAGPRATLGWRPVLAAALCAIGLIALGVGTQFALGAFRGAWLLPG